jgi:lysophospholipase L1-like esterase
MSDRFKTVHLAVQGDVFKTLALDWETNALKPNLVFIHGDGSVFFEINEAGLKGDPIDDQRKLIVVWGDSVVFGVGYSWPRLIDRLAPGYQVLNGGIEGDGFANILSRAAAFNRAHRVALNVVMLGWHPNWMFAFDRPRRPFGPLARLLGRSKGVKGPNRGIRERLGEFLQKCPNTVLLTLPTALNQDIVDRDLTPFFADGDDDTAFTFLARLPYSTAIQRALWEFVNERNAIAQSVCDERGVRVIDLFSAFDSRREPDFRAAFHDILHFRVRSYPTVARLVHDGIKDLLV